MTESYRDKLNEIDHKCLDEDLKFYDLRSLFESVAPKLSTEDKEEIKKVIQNTNDAETIAAVLQAKAMDEKNESLEERYDFDLVDNAIDHFLYDLGREPEVDDVIEYIENTSPEEVPEDFDKYQKWADDISCEISARLSESLEEELIDAPQEVVDELLDILGNHGFILDDSFKVNPGKTFMGAVHLQVINPESIIEDSDEINVQDELQKYVTRELIDEIHKLDRESNCPITWNFGPNENGQVTGGLDIMKQYVEESYKDVYYVIMDKHGNQLSRPTKDDSELWDRVESRDPKGTRGLKVVVYTGKVDEKLSEASYGGSYDIEDDMFFTKEELMEFGYDLVEQFSAWAEGTCELSDLYMTSPVDLFIAVSDEDGAEHQAKVKIDMRKIKLPKDIYKYSDFILKQWKDSYNEYHDYDESLNEDYVWEITYGKGRPGGNIEHVKFPEYKDAFEYASNNDHGWGFDIKNFSLEKSNKSLEESQDSYFDYDESLNESSQGVEYLEDELADKSQYPSIEDAYQRNELTICKFKDRDVYYIQSCPNRIYKLVRREMKKYYPELTYLYDESLNEATINRYSDVQPEEVRNRGWWYFTTHGVQLGSIPKGVHVLETRDGESKNGMHGTFMRLDAILNTSELREYDIREEVPTDESLNESIWDPLEGELNDVYPESLDLLSVEEAEKLPYKVGMYDQWWWLQSPGINSHFATCRSTTGGDFSVGNNELKDRYNGIFVDYEVGAVRPALTVSNLDSSNLELYKKYSLFGTDWVYIGNNQFLYNGKVINHRFDLKSNDYESSEIKQFLDSWLKELQSKDINESLKEDTVKQGNKWVNKGKEGTHGKFRTKKQADAQRKAMFANGYKESLSDGKLNPGDKFKNRNGVEITIIEPQKDGTIQYKIGDEVRAGSERSIQRMLYKNNYLREDYNSFLTLADKDANKLRNEYDKGDKSIFDILTSLNYIQDDPDSVYMYKEVSDGYAIVFDLSSLDEGRNYVKYFVVDENNNIPKGYTITKLLIEDYQQNKDEWGEPYSYDEVERELKSITNNWTDKEGTIRCYWEQEKNYGLQILKKHYKYVETSDGRTGKGEDMSWVLAYSGLKEE